MKKTIVIKLIVIAVVLGGAAVYVYLLGGALPFAITLPSQPFVLEQEHDSNPGTKSGALATALMNLFASPLIIKDGEITGLGDSVPLLSAASGLYTFAPYFPAKDYKIAGFDCGRPMTLYLDYDRNYYCMVKPSTEITYQLLSKGPPYYRTIGPEDGGMAAELLVAQDIYGYHFRFVNKERVNESKSEQIVRDSFVTTMTNIYNETSGELVASKTLFDTTVEGLYFKQLTHLDYGFIISADIRAYYPHDKRIILVPKGGLCITDITISKKTAVSENLLKRVGPIGEESYYLAHRQPLSGNVVIALPDGENYLYVSLSGSGELSDSEVYEYMLTILTIDYTGSLALTDLE